RTRAARGGLGLAGRRLQAALGDLVRRRLVADFEDARALGPVPVPRPQDFARAFRSASRAPLRATSLSPSVEIGVRAAGGAWLERSATRESKTCSVLRTTIRRMTFSSSRTLPGQ